MHPQQIWEQYVREGKGLIFQIVDPYPRETVINLSIGPIETSWSSMSRNAKMCAWEGKRLHSSREIWEATGWTAFLVERTRETQWTLCWIWANSVLLYQIKQILPCYATLGEVWSAEWTKLLFLSTQPWWGCTWNTVSSFGSPWSKGLWRNWRRQPRWSGA